MLKTETEIIVPDVIILKGDAVERTIRLENCHDQNEIMEYLKISLSLSAVNYPEKILESPEATLRISENVRRTNIEVSGNANRHQSFS